MNPLTVLDIGLVLLGLVLFVRGRDPLVRGAGLVLLLPVAMGLAARAVLQGSGMGAGAVTVLTAATEIVSLLVCATLGVLLCASGGSHRGPSAA